MPKYLACKQGSCGTYRLSAKNLSGSKYGFEFGIGVNVRIWIRKEKNETQNSVYEDHRVNDAALSLLFLPCPVSPASTPGVLRIAGSKNWFTSPATTRRVAAIPATRVLATTLTCRSWKNWTMSRWVCQLLQELQIDLA